MNRKRLIQIILAISILIIVGTGLLFSYFRGWIKLRAEGELPSPTNLTATSPGIAEDVIYDHWAYKYIDAVTKRFAEPKDDFTNNKLMNYWYTFDHGLLDTLEFRPSRKFNRVELAIAASRIAYIQGRVDDPNPHCTQQVFKDVPISSEYCGYINLAHHLGLVSIGNCTQSPGLPSYCPAEYIKVTDFKNMLTRTGYPTAIPPGVTILNDSLIERDQVAALLAYNLQLEGNDPLPCVYLQWRFPFPLNDEYGFDFGFEVFRQKSGEAPIRLYTQEAPYETGMEIGSDIGMFYDKEIERDVTYTYYLYLFNRDGDYSLPSEVTITTR